jgi:hypothetical protein
MDWATFWANFSQTHLVALLGDYRDYSDGFCACLNDFVGLCAYVGTFFFRGNVR